LGGGLVSVYGPIELTVVVCGLTLEHPFFYYEDNPTFLMGIDLLTALTIDCESRCVWSKHTLLCHVRQNLADATAKSTLHVNADKFLDTVPSLPVLFPDVETRESPDDHVDETALTQLSMALKHPVLENKCESSSTSDLVLDEMQTKSTSVRLSPLTAIDVGIQCDESSVVTMLDDPVVSTDRSCCDRTGMLSSSEIFCPVQSTLNPQAPSFVTTFEPSPASLARMRNQRLCSSAVACPDDWESSPTQSSLVEHPMSLLSPIEDHDEDVTLLKSHFDPGGPDFPVQVREPDGEHTVSIPTVEGLPEHVTQLFLDTFQQDDFPIEATHGFKKLLIDHQHTFAISSADIGFCSILQHNIDTGDAHPIRQAPKKPPLAAREAEDEILNEMLKTGVTEPSMSSWASLVCIVRKKDNTFRFCIDYRRVNEVSKKDAYPIPDIQDALDNLRGAKYFATFDLLSGYWQLGLTEMAKERSAFCTRRGLFHFTRMPFGLTGAPSTFCRLMSIVLREYLWEICLCYLDDNHFRTNTARVARPDEHYLGQTWTESETIQMRSFQD